MRDTIACAFRVSRTIQWSLACAHTHQHYQIENKREKCVDVLGRTVCVCVRSVTRRLPACAAGLIEYAPVCNNWPVPHGLLILSEFLAANRRRTVRACASARTHLLYWKSSFKINK